MKVFGKENGGFKPYLKILHFPFSQKGWRSGCPSLEAGQDIEAASKIKCGGSEVGGVQGRGARGQLVWPSEDTCL